MKAIRADLPETHNEIELLVLADYHYADPHSDHNAIQRDIQRVEENPNAYCVLAGDLMNCAIKSSVSDTYGDTLSPMDELAICSELLKPIAHKVVGIVGGNHEARHYKTNGIDMTRILEPDEFRGLADPSTYEGRTTEDLKQFDPAVETMTPDDLIALARDLEDAASTHSEAPIQDISSGASCSRTDVYSISSNGFVGERKKTTVSNEVSVVLKSDDGKLPSDYGYSVGCHRADLLDAKTLADDAVRRAMRQLGQIKLPTKNRSVILRGISDAYVENPSSVGGELPPDNFYFLG